MCYYVTIGTTQYRIFQLKYFINYIYTQRRRIRRNILMGES